MSAPRVHIVCQNWQQDRIIPRMGRRLRDRLGWSLHARGANDDEIDVVYLSAYFERNRLKVWPRAKVAAYFTHREEEPPGNAKARLYDRMAARVDLRIVTCEMYAERMRGWGPTLIASAPVEQDRFVPAVGKLTRRQRPVVGVSGYTYPNQRKGEDLVARIVHTKLGERIEWRGSGRGWPVPTSRLGWRDMPRFYQDLDVLLCPSRVEGIPMPPLEALACGVRVVIPRGVGLLDELKDEDGIHRYKCGDVRDMARALEEAAFPDGKTDPFALRAVVSPYTVEAWTEDHRMGFAALCGGGS